MTNLRLIFKDYLKEAGFLKFEKLGTGAPPIVTLSQNTVLKNKLTSQLKSNKTYVLLTIIPFCCLFLVGLIIALYMGDNALILGIIFFSLLIFSLSFLYYLRRCWLEKSMLDVSLSIMDDLPPEEAAKFIQVIYWKLLNK